MAHDPLNISDSLVRTFMIKGGQTKDATDACYRVFTELKMLLHEFERELAEKTKDDTRLKIKYTDRGQFEAEIKVADDVLIFIMHTNAFVFEHSHPLWKSGYLSLKESNGTCGMISIYNFLSDSFKFDRRNDVGQLVARIFINSDENFYVEGKRQLGVMFNDFAQQKSTRENLLRVVEASVLYSLDIDVNVPPFDAMKEISVHEVMTYNLQTAVNAGKRLGFIVQNETPEMSKSEPVIRKAEEPK
jgi:hypothetical protein